MRKLMQIVLMCLLVLNFSQSAYAEDDDGIGDSSAKDDSQIYYIYDGIDLVTTLKFQYPKPKTIIKSVYPLLQSETTNDEAVDTFNNIVVAMTKLESDEFQKRIADLSETQKLLPKPNIKNELNIDYDSSFINSGDEHILSVRFTFEAMITGMAHGYHYHRILNFDLDTGEALELADLFTPDSNYLERISQYTRTALQRRLKDKSMIVAGTEPTPANFRNWNLKPIGLVITFDEYQVAPYVFGAQTVIIPFSALQDIIDPESVVSGCIKHRTRCMRNNLLTGAFIDEAANNKTRKSTKSLASAKNVAFPELY